MNKRSCVGKERADADGARVGSNTRITDIDIVIARGEAKAGPIAQGDVTIPGCIALERLSTGGRVGEAGCIVLERKYTVGRVGRAGGVIIKRLKTSGRVFEAGCVLKERSPPNTGIIAAGGVEQERLKTIGRVVMTGVVFERLSARGRIPTGSCRASKRLSAKGCVVS